jgi:hypothetical protein
MPKLRWAVSDATLVLIVDAIQPLFVEKNQHHRVCGVDLFSAFLDVY